MVVVQFMSSTGNVLPDTVITATENVQTAGVAVHILNSPASANSSTPAAGSGCP